MKYSCFGGTRLVAAALLVAALPAVAGCAKPADEKAAHLSFGTPESATTALATAVERNDTAALRRLLGPGAEDAVSSGDSVADRNGREGFVERYRQKHRLAAGSADELALYVGDDDWPVPFPLVRSAGRWRFDGAAGVDELLLRRIGANELRTIDVMRGFVAAQREYAAAGHDGAPPGVYARALRSSPGRHDGLYWKVSAGEPPSPAGPFLAAAAAEGYGDTPNAAGVRPYHGYVYRILLAQGPSANGGARDYVENGKLTGGVALLARPQIYGTSGVMTFMVGPDDVVWQRDFGAHTAEIAAKIDRFDPDSTWTPIPPAPGVAEAAAGEDSDRAPSPAGGGE